MNDELLMSGVRLKQERKRLNIATQEELAVILGVKKNSIVRYEKHNDPLRQDHLIRLRDKGFDINYIVFGEKCSEPSDDNLKLIALFNSIPDENKTGLMEIVSQYAKQFIKTSPDTKL